MELKIESELLELLWGALFLIQVWALVCKVKKLRRTRELHRAKVELAEAKKTAFGNFKALMKKYKEQQKCYGAVMEAHNDLVNTLNHAFNKDKDKNGDSPINNDLNLN